MARSSATWNKGKSGNPNGRPPNAKCLTDLLRRKLAAKDPDGKPKMDVITDKVIALALTGERWAVELIYDRLEGRPPQALELTGGKGPPLRITYVDGDKKA
ncbi:unnamed protein product [marine sediment metagenome]|uniref:DUF5681 domain-containing protein n=1 Tax=marine sediment metagenome TaxID=412755 RepID=X0VSM8_9ZZZZ